MNLIIFVHTCALYEESRAKKIEATWGNRENVVFITDNPNSSLRNHLYIGEYEKGKTYHPKNVIKMFNLFIEKYTNYDWFMMIDDDSYLYIDKLINYLQFQDKDDCLMIGDFLNWLAARNMELTYKHIGGGPGIVFTKKCIITYLDLIKDYKERYDNHDLWLHKLFNFSNKKSIKRIHCCGFHQYGTGSLPEQQLKSMSKNLLISIHLERKMDLLYKFHNLHN